MINKTKTECESKLCYYDSATRTRFYHGMLLTDDHLRAEQEYHREALKRVNRHLWGSGVVCGLQLVGPKQGETGLCFKIEPGVALDCCGNLIEVCKCVTVDLTKECEKRYGPDCMPAQPLDPIVKYVVLSYKTIESDPEPVLASEGDCNSGSEKSNCNASKVREGFCVELWDECPCPEPMPEDDKGLMSLMGELGERASDAGQSQPRPKGPQQQTPGAQGTPAGQYELIDLPLPCSPCACCESAVGLGKVTIDCAKKMVKIEYDCRRTIITPRLLSWLFSRIAPKHMSAEMSSVYEKMPERSVANLTLASMVVEDQAYQIKQLKDTVGQQIHTEVEKSMKKAARTGLPKKP
jgi:hypothetical protein